MTTVIVMPGTGSDADFVARVFGPAARAAGLEPTCLEPTADLVPDYLSRIDAHVARGERVVVGGVSIGAAVALRWALDERNADHCDGVLAALPPWSGAPDGSIAAASARLTADGLDRDGLDATIDAMVATSPDWLGAELSRSWRSLHGRGLVDQLRAASTFTAPTLADIAGLRVPLGVAVAPDDPLHPASVGRAWVDAAPRAALVETPLSAFGPDERRLGDACWSAWLRACAR
ncbi:alpha/beta fold hydrolase [Gordonia humi]|uniref:Pimeloyl-ACP methyl ester carboxylesterase n=1 Tax=Gordonia humi TaxID=686429 RepID=A0A840F0Q7_9ACTN|nr:alpha/beta hydrolase [Gordonia humi]MBB4136204.1 pimeloyl-ACP methyl ester carboxylesterase [Gordonia humi]